MLLLVVLRLAVVLPWPPASATSDRGISAAAAAVALRRHREIGRRRKRWWCRGGRS